MYDTLPSILLRNVHLSDQCKYIAPECVRSLHLYSAAIASAVTIVVVYIINRILYKDCWMAALMLLLLI